MEERSSVWTMYSMTLDTRWVRARMEGLHSRSG
jgi:hypothetical protein